MQTRRRALRRIPNARPQAQPPRRIVGAWIHSLPGPVFPERKPTPVGCRHAPSGFAGQKKEWAQPIRTRTPTWCGRPGCQFSIRDPLHRAAPVPGIRTLRRRMRCGQRFDLTLIRSANGGQAEHQKNAGVPRAARCGAGSPVETRCSRWPVPSPGRAAESTSLAARPPKRKAARRLADTLTGRGPAWPARWRCERLFGVVPARFGRETGTDPGELAGGAEEAGGPGANALAMRDLWRRWRGADALRHMAPGMEAHVQGGPEACAG